MGISLTDDKLTGPQLDITGAQDVEVKIRKDGKVLWVNVDNVCRLRVCKITNLVVEDSAALRVAYLQK